MELSQAVYAPYFVLRGDSLFYLNVDTGGSTRSPDDIVSSVYKVDLNGLAETLFYTSEAVSYTHLDVYKRQCAPSPLRS